MEQDKARPLDYCNPVPPTVWQTRRAIGVILLLTGVFFVAIPLPWLLDVLFSYLAP